MPKGIFYIENVNQTNIVKLVVLTYFPFDLILVWNIFSAIRKYSQLRLIDYPVHVSLILKMTRGCYVYRC